jgi:hypothetical protein
MKYLKLIAVAIAALAASMLCVKAQSLPLEFLPGSNAVYSAYSVGSTNAGTLAWAVIGNNSLNGGIPVLTSINATSDKAGSKLQFYRVLKSVQATYTNSTTQIMVQTTNGFLASDVIVIKHLQNDSYEKRILASGGSFSTGATNLVVTVAPGEAVLPGDMIYRCATANAGYIAMPTNATAVGGFSLSLQGNYIYAGQRGLPLLMELDATTTGNINSAMARFEP